MCVCVCVCVCVCIRRLTLKTPQVYIHYAVFPQDFPKFPQISPGILSKYSNSKLYQGLHLNKNKIISFAFERAVCGL